MNVIVDGLMTSYQKTGKGETLLLIHGWGDSAKTFSALADQLKGSYQIVALDLPGFGGSQTPTELWGTAAFADFTRHFIKKLGLKPLAVVGHSFGGAVAIELAGNRPFFKDLILLASAGVRNKKSLKSAASKVGAKTAKPLLLIIPRDKRDRLKRKVYDSIGSDALLLPHMEAIYRRIVAEDMRPAANQINIPTLLIYGSSDKATPIKDGHILNRAIRNSRLEIIMAGHFLHQEEPERIASLIRDFLES